MLTQGKIGFIGLGAMGAPMAARLVDFGWSVQVYDVRSARTDLLGSLGAAVADSVADLARASDVVLTSLPSEESVRQVVLDADSGVVAGLRDRRMLIELSTVSVELSQQISARFEEQGLVALDAPVSAASGPAEKGELTIMVGGSASAVAAARPVLECLGRRVVHLGAAGMGTATKLATQYMGLCNAVAAAEGALLAEAAGVDMERLAEVLGGTIGQSLMVDPALDWVKTRNLAEPETPRGVVGIFEKDIRLGVRAAGDLGSPHILGSAVAGLYSEAIARGWGERRFLAALDVALDTDDGESGAGR